MAGARKSGLPKVLDLPLAIAAALTFGFYWVITQEAMKATLLHRYTTEHLVEYVVVALSFWGLADVLGKLFSYPRQLLALRHGERGARRSERLGRQRFVEHPTRLQQPRCSQRR